MEPTQAGGNMAWLGQLLANRGDMVLMLLGAMAAVTTMAKSFMEHGGGPYLKSLAERTSADAAVRRHEADLLALKVAELKAAPSLSDRMDGLERSWRAFLEDAKGHADRVERHVEGAARMLHDPEHDRRGRGAK